MMGSKEEFNGVEGIVKHLNELYVKLSLVGSGTKNNPDFISRYAAVDLDGLSNDERNDLSIIIADWFTSRELKVRAALLEEIANVKQELKHALQSG